MIEKLVSMYKKGSITADHLVVECLHMLDPKCPALVLDHLPNEILERMLKYINEYQPQSMRSNYGLPPALDQVAAAKHWIEAATRKTTAMSARSGTNS